MKSILITGGRSGIIADAIKKIINDYHLYITVHTLSEYRAIKKIYKDYKNVECFKLDITKDLDKINNIKVDILICNGAVIETGSLIDMPFNKIYDTMEVNYFSNLKLIRKVIRSNDNVRVIVISSLASKMNIPFLGPYSSSKAALSSMIKSLRYETVFLDKNIKIILIEPGLYKTGFNKMGFDKKYEFMDIDSFFNDNINLIHSLDNILLLFERKKLNTISKKIVKAIKDKNPKFYYSAPISQYIFVKLYNFLCNF